VSEDPEKKIGAATAEADAQARRTEAEARAAELREEVAITDERRAEEEKAKAQEAVAEAEKEESKKERKRREAEERQRAAAAEAERAREQAGAAAEQARTAPAGQRDTAVSGAAVSSPGVGSDPKAAAVAASRVEPATAAPRSGEPVEDPDKPELYVGAAFVGAFLFARILKRIAE
jgi:translation initiation factor IF-2